jgi:hypothetical protein
VLIPGSQTCCRPAKTARAARIFTIFESQGLIVIRRGSLGGTFVAQPDLSWVSHTLAPVLTLSKAP